MSIYVYRANSDNKLHFFYCECGSLDLSHPRNSESDHRDVLRFKCNKCGHSPYFTRMDESDVIPITLENMNEVKQELCEQWKIEPANCKFCKEVEDIIMNKGVFE